MHQHCTYNRGLGPEDQGPEDWGSEDCLPRGKLSRGKLSDPPLRGDIITYEGVG